jgi:hypothetical protein
MVLPDRLRLPLAFDPAPLARDLERASAHGWTKHFVRENYEGDWSVIALRAVAGVKRPSQMIYSNPTATNFENTPMIEGCPCFHAVMESFACPIRTMRLMRLTPGSLINEHSDPDLSFEDGTVRIHIPISTNPDVDFRLNGTRTILEPGSAWYLRLSDPHSVANRGTTDRVHLVIDMSVNAWLANLFEQAVFTPA